MATKVRTKARDVMTQGSEVVNVDDTVQRAARLMADGDLGALPVCGADRKLVGMLTDRDLAVRVIADGRNPSSTRVAEVVSGGEVVTIGADDSRPWTP